MDSWQRRGISLTYESPDTVFLAISGEVESSPATELVNELVRWASGKPYVVLILDVSGVLSYSAGARKVLATNGHRLPPRIFAHFGGSYTTQVMLEMMFRGSTSLGSKNRWATHWPDEIQARAWVDEMRPQLAQQAEALSKQK